MRRYSIGVFFDIWSIDHKKWQDQAEFIKSLGGVEHIELMLEIVELKPASVAFLKKLLKPYKIVLHAPFMNLAYHSPHPEIVEASLKIVKKAVKVGKQMGADTMTFHVDSYPNYYSDTQVIRDTQNILNKLASDTKMKIGLENMSKGGNMKIFYPSEPEDLHILSKKFNKNVGFTVDIGHFLYDQHDSVKVIQQLKQKVFDIHLHDGENKKAHLQLGKGNLDLKRLIRTLDQINYSGFLTIEVMGREEVASSWITLKSALMT